jgi:hypothetical protein
VGVSISQGLGASQPTENFIYHAADIVTIGSAPESV